MHEWLTDEQSLVLVLGEGYQPDMGHSPQYPCADVQLHHLSGSVPLTPDSSGDGP